MMENNTQTPDTGNGDQGKNDFERTWPQRIFLDPMAAEFWRALHHGPMAERIAKMETRMDQVDVQLKEIKNEVSGIRYWIIGGVATTLLGIAATVIAFGSYQSGWFQHSLNRNWEISLKTLEKIDATMLRMERMDAEKKSFSQQMLPDIFFKKSHTSEKKGTAPHGQD
ncbi:MAG: hypothetical protein LBQ51_05565 [Desulfovibrio sp.]|jgi:uncharacterized protein (UPF0335 family)|nr:hypothetical protein [Desulfovibrio sp.]